MCAHQYWLMDGDMVYYWPLNTTQGDCEKH